MKLISFGEILWDIYPDEKFLGGAPLNLAAHAVLQGSKGYMLSAVGDDYLGRELIENVQNLGVNTKYICISEKETGKCLVTLDENAIPHYNLLDDVSYDYISLNGNLENFDVLAFGTLALRSKHNINTLKNVIKNNTFKEIYSDLNIRPPHYSNESINFCLANATIVKISDEELPTITNTVFNVEMKNEDALINLSDKFGQIKIIILTLGEKGSLCFDSESKKFYYQNAIKCIPISTVGAGDSFGATFLTEYMKGRKIEDCLKKSSKVSSFVVSSKDAVPPDIAQFLKNI